MSRTPADIPDDLEQLSDRQPGTRSELLTGPVLLATPDDTEGFGRQLAGVLRAGDVVCLVGQLGAGKTTLVRGLAAGLGVRGPVTSPTFVICRVHPSLVDGPALVHVDAYRLHGVAELDDLDLDSTLDGSVTVIEWGTGFAQALTSQVLEVELRRNPEPAGEDDSGDLPDLRWVTVRGRPGRWAASLRTALPTGVADRVPDDPPGPPVGLDHGTEVTG